ncbi:MarR family transcriptional regulator [Streptomyces sp. MUM 178J]|uniref:MarR family transcriptional regulator n=1 Tax=Streptomyces sp. MUM 178J TaxID=2791991 RepID=UPI001F03D24F|nr:MarR family transcriptional regulator [Streptomyces sp. MUM 178J]WRQ82015.1 MarR family transcriptional regulator [Streptomyces sp. MUM 178J]
MASSSDSLKQDACDLLTVSLDRCVADRATGTLHVAGAPGGTMHMRRGAVIAVESPGSPAVCTLLLRSGRIREDAWLAVLGTGTTPRDAVPALVAHGCLGAAELKVLARMAARDAVFAMAAGPVWGCRLDADAALPDVVLPDADPRDLLREAVWRRDALATLPVPVGPDRERFVPAPGVDMERERGPVSRERLRILRSANGRRSARDIAFVIGRGVYTVTVDMSRMLAEGLIEVVGGGPEPRSASGSRGPGAAPPRGAPTAAPSAASAAPSREPLPRRSPGASGINEILPAVRPSGWTDFAWLRQGRRGLLRGSDSHDA